MQNDKTYSEILSLISTERQKDELVNQIENLFQAVYKLNSQESRNEAEEGMDIKIVEILKSVPTDKLPEFLVILKEKINSLSLVKITLSFNPSLSFIKKLHSFLSQALAAHIVIDTQVAPEIIGGLIIELEGKFIDLTLRKKINELVFPKVNESL